MFGLEDDELIANLEKMRLQRCGYAGDRCDCKYGADLSKSSEQTGCPELAQAIAILRGQRDDVIVLRQRLEQTAFNKLSQIRRLLADS